MAKYLTKRNIIILVLVLLVGVFLFNGLSGRLRIEAWQNKRYLSNLRVLDNQEVKATARPNGDMLTGSSSPAKATLITQDKLGALHAEISRNLSQQGYSINDEFDFLIGNYQNPAGINLRATNGTKYLNIGFIFSEKQQCKEELKIYQLCKFSQSIPVADSGLLDVQVREIVLNYNDDRRPSN